MHQEAQCDGQVEGTPALAHIGGRQVYRDLARGNREARVLQSCHYPLPALPDGALRQTHHRECREPGGEVNLHLHDVALHSLKGGGLQLCQH